MEFKLMKFLKGHLESFLHGLIIFMFMTVCVALMYFAILIFTQQAVLGAILIIHLLITVGEVVKNSR